MLRDWPCVGPSRTDSTKSDNFLRQSQQTSVRCPKSNTVDYHPVASPSIDTIFRKLLKRARSLDTDGEEEEHTQRKKRRLRLHLVTSRLSRPYASPATHIIGTKAWRVGPWARQRFTGGKLLRKAALLNWTSMKSKKDPLSATKKSEGPTGGAASQPHVSPMASRPPQRAFAAPATFQMPSDYDVFDYEEDDIEENQEEDNEEDEEEDSSDGESQAIHSDFGRLEASDTDPDFFDTSWSFANIDADDPEVDSSGVEFKLVMENEKQDEVSIAPTRPGIFASLHTRNPVMGM